MQYMVPDKLYKILKWAALIVLPAASTLIATVGPAWGMDGELVQSITTTVTAVATFFGLVLGVSQATAKPTGGEDA